MFGLGTTEILIILLVCVLIFGASRLPAIGKSLGGGIRSFRKSVSGDDDDDDEAKVLDGKKELNP